MGRAVASSTLFDMTRLQFTAAIDGLAGRDLVRFARELERQGFVAAKVADSICYPEQSDSKYPYSPDGSREFLDNRSFLDPFVLAGAVSAVTERLHVFISVLKLPVRHPVLVAKQAASAAVLSGNRLILGVGMSPWPDDYEILGVPWEGRGARFDACIEIVRTFASGGYAEHRGDLFQIPRLKIQPAPTKPVPVVIGGHGRRSLERAARVGDGWTAAGCSVEELDHMLATLRSERTRSGRLHLPFQVHASISHDTGEAEMDRLEGMGVTHVAVNWTDRYAVGRQDSSIERRLERVVEFGERVIAGRC